MDSSLATIEPIPRPEEAQPTAPIVLWTGADLARPLPPIPWVVQGLEISPGAPTLLAGVGFSGKTLLAQSLVLSVASGRRAFGAHPVRQGRAIHLDYEQGATTSWCRYQRLGRATGITDLADLADLRFGPMPRLALDRSDTSWLEWLCAGATLLVIDSLRAAAPTLDENSSEMRRPLDVLTRVSEATGCAVVVIHHGRKPREDDRGSGAAQIRGSGAIFDACSNVLVLRGLRPGVVRVSHQKARVTGMLRPPFDLAIEDVEVDGVPRAGLSVQPIAPGRPEQSALEEALIDLVRRQPGLSQRDIEKVKGLGSAAQRRQARDRLLEQGRLRRESRGGAFAFFPTERVCVQARPIASDDQDTSGAPCVPPMEGDADTVATDALRSVAPDTAAGPCRSRPRRPILPTPEVSS